MNRPYEENPRCPPLKGEDPHVGRELELAGGVMKELLKKLDREYGFNLSEAEMERVLAEVRAAEPLFEQLNSIDVAGKTPFVRLDVKRAEK